jgi:long-chain acyl-CoA synthetase
MSQRSTNLGDILQNQSDISCEITEVDPVELAQRTYTSQQLESHANAVAAYLSAQGYQPQDPVAIISNNCLEFIACHLGIMKLGAVSVLISSKSTQSQIQNMLQASQAKFIFADRHIDTGLPVTNLKNLLEKLQPSHEFKSYQPAPTDLAFILHTSGSTGQPKQVLYTHSARLKMHSADSVKKKILFTSPMFHVMGINNLEMQLYSKNDLVFLKSFEPAAFLKTINLVRPTRLVGVPSVFHMMLLEEKILSTLDFSSVQEIILAGGATGQQLYDRLSQIFDRAQIYISYGTTEIGPKIFGPHPTLPTPPLSVGCEQPGAALRLVDGVLQVRSQFMMKGYGDNSHRFTDDGYYVTNDLFRIDSDGFYYFVGRSDDMFKSGGNKIFPSEIEQVVEMHPAVNKCVVVPVSDPVKDYKPYAFVTLDKDIAVQELIQFASDHLAHYQLPRQIWIIDAMPLTIIGKIDYDKLKILTQQNLNI